MHPVWERERGRLRTIVEPEAAAFSVEHEFPLERTQVWDFLTKPEYRAILTGSSSTNVKDRTNGRMGTGAAYQCAHGENISEHTIVDWQPFEQYTIRSAVRPEISFLSTSRLTPIEGGTRVALSFSKCIGGSPIRRFLYDTVGRITGSRNTRKGFEALKSRKRSQTAPWSALSPPRFPLNRSKRPPRRASSLHDRQEPRRANASSDSI